MKKVIVISAATLLVVVVLGGLGAAYVILSSQDRGTTADGHLKPPPSAINASAAPTFDADAAKSKPSGSTTEKPPEYQLPTEFKLPTEMDISVPAVPEGLSTPADGQKS
jgi:hypothetical protein